MKYKHISIDVYLLFTLVEFLSWVNLVIRRY